MNLNKELKAEWKRYVESYNEDGMKKVHLLSCTHVVNRLIDTATSNSQQGERARARGHLLSSGDITSNEVSLDALKSKSNKRDGNSADTHNPVVILDDNELSMAMYAEEYPENFKAISEAMK